MKIKVLHVINDLSLGGAETLLTNWLPLLKKNEDFEIEVLVFLENLGTDANVLKLEFAGIKVHSLNLNSLYSITAMSKLLGFFKKQKRYDVVHVHLFPAFYWLALIKAFLGTKKTKYIFTEHSTHNKRIGRKKYFFIEKYIYNKYDFVVAISDAVYNKISTWVIHPSKIKLIKNGLLINRAMPSDLKSQIMEHRGCKTILMVARFVASKGHVELVKALSIVKREKNLKFHLYLAGDGVELKNIKNLVTELDLENEVTFLGYVLDGRSLMNNVDLNVLSSEYEGFSGVTIESILSKKPFIGSNVDGIREIVAHPKSLYEHGNLNELADRIVEFLTNDNLVVMSVDKNYNYALQFDINLMVNKHAELYRSLIITNNINSN